jgi:hypothetical protein
MAADGWLRSPGWCTLAPVVCDHTLELFRVMCAEAQKFRGETRRNFAIAFHPLNVIEATLANLRADVAILLSSVPVMNERFDALEARVAALEAGR